MKKKITILVMLLLGMFILSGCTRTFYYDYDELMDGLLGAEIIYLEEEVIFFEIHWYVDVTEDDYVVKRELTPEESERMVRALSRITFVYTDLFFPGSAMYFMEGYAIKLTYRSSYIIVAQTGDYRPGRGHMLRLPQRTAGRRATDEDWHFLITEGCKEEEEGLSLTPVIITAIGFIFLMFFAVLLVAPYLGWNYKYEASVSKILIRIPKAKKYSINIRRKGDRLLREHGHFYHVIPKVDFQITNVDTGETIRYFPALNMVNSNSGSSVTKRLGFFVVPSPNQYLIEGKPDIQFAQSDKIIIRKDISRVKQVLLMIGLCISGYVFVQGMLMLLERV